MLLCEDKEIIRYKVTSHTAMPFFFYTYNMSVESAIDPNPTKYYNDTKPEYGNYVGENLEGRGGGHGERERERER